MRRIRLLALLAALGAPGTSWADIVNFDLDGKIYTKWLYRNNASQGCLSYGNPNLSYGTGNPNGGDNFSGDNGVCSEFELLIRGKVSDFVESGVRLKSRFGSDWHDWWENGNQRFDSANTSGESLGMDHAEYIKLRGYWIRVAPPIPGVRWVHVGSTDLSMFNPWTIGKTRYIDRDNAKGIFLEGSFWDRAFAYHLGIIALPKLYVGPSWSTGLGDSMVEHPFLTQDWAYGLTLRAEPLREWSLTFVGMVSNDFEFNFNDPDVPGAPYPTCTDPLGNPIPSCEDAKDGAASLDSRYLSSVLTLGTIIEPWDILSLDLFFGFSLSRVDPRHADNGVETNAGVFPIIYKVKRDGLGEAVLDEEGYMIPELSTDIAAKARLDLDDPFDIGLSFHMEYFYIGKEWNAIFGARREEDVLLTDGFVEGGQLPTLNIANEFIDFDESWYESCVGWHGGTLQLELVSGGFEGKAEFSVITYNTNNKDGEPPPDINSTYPNFLFVDGYTDTDLYDYANTGDRGRDLRSVYHQTDGNPYQNRLSMIAVLWLKYVFDVGRGLELGAKFKTIIDNDDRNPDEDFDNYNGVILTGRGSIGYQFTDELKVDLGYQGDLWLEGARSGSLAAGYQDYQTTKHKAFAMLYYDFAGARLKYTLEYINKNQDLLEDPLHPAMNRYYSVVRSKASLEVSW